MPIAALSLLGGSRKCRENTSRILQYAQEAFAVQNYGV